MASEWGLRYELGEPAEQAAGPGRAQRWTDIVERLSMCSRVLRRALAEQCAAVELSDVQLSILWAARRNSNGIAQNALAAELGLSTAHVSGLVEGLQTRSLMESRRHATDRRRQMWRLSPAGSALLASLMDRWDAALASSGELLQDQRWGEVLQLLDALCQQSPQRMPAVAVPTDASTQRRCA